MKTHKVTVEEIVRARAIYNGMTISSVAKKTGISQRTFARRLKYNDWRLDEIRILDRYLHFTDEDLRIFVRGN